MDKGKDARKPGWFWADNKLVDIHAADIGIHAFGVYMVLVRYLNGDDESWPSTATIARILGISQRSVVRAVKVLADKHLIEITAREKEGKGQISNLYTVHRVGAPHEETADTPMTLCHRGVTDSHRAYDRESGAPMTESHTNNTNVNKTKGTSGGVGPKHNAAAALLALRVDGRGLTERQAKRALAKVPDLTVDDVEVWAAYLPTCTADSPIGFMLHCFDDGDRRPRTKNPRSNGRINGHASSNGHAAAAVIDRAAIAENERLARAELEAEGIAWE